MATMIAKDIEEFGTEGEKAFYKLLEGGASWMPTTSAGTRLISTETNLISCPTGKRSGVRPTLIHRRYL